VAVLESVLIVSSEKGQRSLAQLINARSGGSKLITATSGNEARRILLNQDFDVVIINAPLIDETGQDLAMLVAHQSGTVLLLIKSDSQGILQPHLEDCGIIVLQKPLNRMSFDQTLALVRITNRRVEELQAENRKLLRKLDELRIVSRAKCLLVAHKGMSEDEAHSYIERLAMDRRETKFAIAESVVKNYLDD
jgi:response regulator NasT